MKKHNRNKSLDSALTRQRFSIRKLSIGAVSVLLGTVFYLGNNVQNQVVHAATEDETSLISNTNDDSSSEQQDNVDQGKQAVQNSTNTFTPPKSEKQRETIESQVTSDDSKQIITSKEDSESLTDNNDRQVQNNRSDNSENSLEVKKTIVQDSNTNKDKINSKLLADSKIKQNRSQNNGNLGDSPNNATNDLTADKTQINSGDNISFTFSTNNAKAGDVYKIEIPEVGDGFDASGTYKVQAADFQGNYGNATTSYDSSRHTWIVTDTFTKANTSVQTIILSTNSNFRKDKLQSTGNYKRTVTLFKNNDLIKTLDFHQKVDVSTDVNWQYEKAISTQEGNVVAKNADDARQQAILPNTDYRWNMDVYINPYFNHGTTINVPMPEYFKLDQTATEAINSDLSQYHISFTQNGKNVQITLPQLTDSELANLKSNKISPVIVGKFDMGSTPTSNTLLTPKENSQVILTYNSGEETPNISHTNVIPALINGEDHGLNKLPIGSILTGNIDPDTYEYKPDGSLDYSKPVTSLDNKDSHALNRRLYIGNKTPFDLTNVKVNIDIPDGMNITSFNSSESNNFSYVFTLDDGSKVNGTYTKGSTPSAPTGHTIKKIQVTYDHLAAYGSTGSMNLIGVLAKNYSNGKPLEAGQNLHTEFDAGFDNRTSTPWSANQKIVEKSPVAPDIHKDIIMAYGNQSLNLPGEKEAGYITAYTSDTIDDPSHLTFYVTIPTNTEINSVQDTKGNAIKYQVKQINGRTVVVISDDYKRGKRYSNPTLWTIKLNNSNLITRSNMNSDFSVYVQLPKDESMNNGSGNSKNTFPFIDNAWTLVENQSWNILTALGTYNSSQAKGNLNESRTSTGNSDDKGTSQMTVVNNIVNGQDKDLTNVTMISTVPSKADKKSEFNFTLDDNGVTVEKSSDSQTTVLDSGYTQLYSTDDIDLNTISDDPDYKKKFVTADKITDWSKVKAVLTQFNKIDKNSVYNIVMKGKDSNLTTDIGKTAYASNVVWSDVLNPLVITPGSKNSASITIQGKSTVHFKLHFEDGSHPDISIPSMDRTYTDNKDTINQSDFISATKNSDFDDAVADKNKDYSKIPKDVLDQIPDGYVLDIENPTIENSDAVYPDGKANNKVKFGQIAKYDSDGDTVIYNLVKKQTIHQTITLTRHVKYVEDETNNNLKKDESSTTQIEVDQVYNPLTDKVNRISYTDLINLLHSKGFNWGMVSTDPVGDYQWTHRQIGDYSSSDTNDNSGNSEAVADALETFLESIDSSNINQGYSFEFVPQKGLVKTKNESALANNVHVVENIVEHYMPSHANLIIIGAGNGDSTTLLESSTGDSNTSTSNIIFRNTDNTLKALKGKDWTYKVYYLDESIVSAMGQSSTEGISIASVDRNILNNQSLSNPAAEYNTLAEALKANSRYDNQADYEYNTDPTESGYGSSAQQPLKYTQNFFVVYEPVESNKQTLYILSDNDPYADDPHMKDFAIPKTEEEADRSGTDYFKVEGETGDNLIKHSSNSNFSIYNDFINSGMPTTYTNGMYDYDKNGNLIHHKIPDYNPDNSDQNLAMIPVYDREGYYINEAKYQYVDSNGQEHTVVIKDNYNGTPLDLNENNSSSDFTGNYHMWQLLEYLATSNKNNEQGVPGYPELDSGQGSSFEITVDGIPQASVITNSDGKKILKLDPSRTWTFDNTKYDSKTTKVDPSPQIITLHYAPIPLSEETKAQVKIHYINVDGVDHLDPSEVYDNTGKPYELDKDTNRYGYGTQQQGKEWDPQSNQWSDSQIHNPITYTLDKYSDSYNNDESDKKIIAKLAKMGFVVVQRDKQTLGSHKFNPFSSDKGNGSLDGNNPNIYSGSINNVKNYYVYLKSSRPINYQVLVEDENGNVENQPLVSKTQLGIGGVDENISSSRVDPNDFENTKTLGQKYTDIVNSINENYRNYELVPSDSVDTKLKKTDVLDSTATFTSGDPKLLTIYVVHKKGDIHIHYIDVDGKTAGPSGFEPSDGTEISNTEQTQIGLNYGDTYSNTPWSYESHNYLLATDTLPSEAQTGTIDGPSKDVYVYLKHNRQVEPTVETKTVKETIHYIYENHTTAKPDYQASITFTRHKIKDLVTNETTEGKWNNSNGTFAEVDSPTIAGYTPDQVKVDEITVTPNSKDIEKWVVYTADGQKAKLRFYDDTDKNFINADPELNILGKSNAPINFNIPSTYDFNNYTFNGVTAGSNVDSHGELDGDKLSEVKYGNFDTDDNTDQVFIAHFTHRKQKVSESKTVHEVIHYVYEGGSKAAEDYTAELSFERHGSKDLVTGEVTYTPDWKSKSFSVVTSPKITGYTPDHEQIDKILVNPSNAKDVTKVVTYKADKQNAKLRFYDDTNKKFIDADPELNTSGKSNGSISFDIPSTYNFDHYNFEGVTVGQETDSSTKLDGDKLSEVKYGNFDTDDNTDQEFIAHFTHRKQNVTESKTVHEVIHYVYEGGSKAAEDHTADLSFERNGSKDLATGTITYTPDWKSKSFSVVVSPKITGYTPDHEQIDEIAVDPSKFKDGAIITKVVTYSADSQNAKLRFYDDTDKKFIDADPELNTSGKSKGSINFDIPSTYNFDHYNFEGVTVGQETDSSTKLDGSQLSEVEYGNFDTDDNTDQEFIAHFTHRKQKVAESKTVHEVIHYIYEGGTKAAEDHTADLSFERHGSKDLVTGAITYTPDWTINNFSAVISPKIEGYTPDHEQIDKISVDPSVIKDGDTITRVVTYNADRQKAILRFYDDTDKKLIDADPELNTSGESNSSINFDIPSTYNFDNYDFSRVTSGTDANSSIKLDGDQLSQIKYGKYDSDDKVDQIFIAHFTHETKPAIDQRTITEIIHYIYEDGSKAANDYIATSTKFIRNKVTDLVTNKVTYGDWNKAGFVFNVVTSPVIKGYTPDQLVISKITVTPNSKNIEKTVVYKADKQNAKLRFYDDTDKKFIDAAPDLNVSGKSNGQISFDIPSTYNLNNYKFEVVTVGQRTDSSNKLNGNKLSEVKFGKYDADLNTDQIFIAHFTHKVTNVVENKTVHELIHYIYEDGSKAANNHTADITFERVGTKDLVTGKVKYTKDWATKEFPAVISPKIKNYTPDHEQIDQISVDPAAVKDGDTITKVVTYTAISKPDNSQPVPDNHPTTPPKKPQTPPQVPNSKDHEEPKNPENPTNKVKEPNKTPKKPKISNDHKKSEKVPSRTHQNKDRSNSKASSVKGENKEKRTITSVSAKGENQVTHKAEINKNNRTSPLEESVQNNNANHATSDNKEERLPQTGTKHSGLAFIGMGLASLATLLGLAGDRKKEK